MSATILPFLKADAFANELTLLCKKHRIGMTPLPTLYVLEPADHAFSYFCDEDSQLRFEACFPANPA